MGIVLVLVSMVLPATGSADNDGITDHIETPVREAIEIRQKAQHQEDQWHDEKQKRLAQLDALYQEQARLNEQRESLLTEKKSLEERVASKTDQLERMRQISDQITPYIDEVLTRLHHFLETDAPFLPQERQRRIENLDRLMVKTDVAASEKMRKLLETLMVEAEYGRTIEVYRDSVMISGQPVLAEIFRFGRVALFYQDLNGRECGFFNVAEKTWQPLPDKYKKAIAAAIEIGNKTRPAELISLPVGRIDHL